MQKNDSRVDTAIKHAAVKHRLTAAAGIILLSLGMYSGCLYKGVRVAGLEYQAKVLERSNYRILGEAEGTSSSFNLLWILPVTPRIDYDRAVSEAIKKLNGDNLINVRTWFERQVWIIGMVEILHVKGTVIKYEY